MVTGLRRAGPGDPGRGRHRWTRRPAWQTSTGWPPRPWTRAYRSSVDWHGSREPLPADIDLSAFRIIQEAVTNVVRHAGHRPVPGAASTSRTGSCPSRSPTSGRGGSAAGTGYGITGMRERAALLGGDFSAGPRPGGGFRVAARLPLPAPASADDHPGHPGRRPAADPRGPAQC